MEFKKFADRKQVNVNWYFILTEFVQNDINTEQTTNRKTKNIITHNYL